MVCGVGDALLQGHLVGNTVDERHLEMQAGAPGSKPEVGFD